MTKQRSQRKASTVHGGYLCPILHAHLPFVRHPEAPAYLEENWLFEAILDCYLPLLTTFQRLCDDRVPFRLAMSFSPPLIYMLRDPLLQQRFRGYLANRIDFAAKELQRTRFTPDLQRLARYYYDHWTQLQTTYESTYRGDILEGFLQFHASGQVELLACAATHAFLPNFEQQPASVAAQVRIGVEVFRRHFAHQPAGFWLPECGYFTGLDHTLRQAGLEYFVVEATALQAATPAPSSHIYSPIRCPSGMAAFGRDAVTAHQVWSAHGGYPGDPDYREFHRDAGMELDYAYVKPYLDPSGVRAPTGLKYWRVTGHTSQKGLYDPQLGNTRAREHAQHFVELCARQLRGIHGRTRGTPLITAPFDAELFGHWWYEGPQWIEHVARCAAQPESGITLMSPADYLVRSDKLEICQPAPSSWGHQGYARVWLDKSNDWIYPHLHRAGRRIAELATHQPSAPDDEDKSLHHRALQQAAREVLLAQASDWPFIMKMGTVVPYAEQRIRNHIHRFLCLDKRLQENSIDEAWLREVESRDNIFADIDCARYFTQA